ncbi:sterol O-acyltransferase 2 isoform X2 [Hyposmocoma kahamanoa]|nr:sterol O-acyltransferase 2 isoform X2 [Hyposmocoma kahamanoa]XP_026329703.1 sterol O-acyltransferase 2 isoform X2 [Hyposmocoma kahamanoa]XP_026329704.1 sterol O-acyltransferase 2 isoform X2 [Hyposmocoma kahamanoa]XP_026329705.1 sterol O-acyltransferase 2 isoform X2 [Hyposmocoma kahamanoa]XP_026329706.1 sterol O-acyltransferase 2 isoform X2 [Hyposmocoma kahamanoa]
MAQENVVRRHKGNQSQNGDVKREAKPLEPEFIPRESPLTVLIQNSLHIRAIYHIFVAILIILLLDTAIYDLVESGKLNIGIKSIVYGFGNISRGLKLWLFDLTVTFAFYPGMLLYAAGAKLLKKVPVVRKAWTMLGILGVAALEFILVAIPVKDLFKEHLALGSSVAVTCEMFRLAMKIYAMAVVCAPRCHNRSIPLPSFKQYIYFLFAPTLLYRDQYPRTKKTRWRVVMFYFMEVAAVIFYNCFLWERFILPNWSDYGKKPTVEAGVLVRSMFSCVLPGVISFLCGFYVLLHAWLNAFAEILRFADRLFYEEWWTTSQFSRYYRAWNRVVYAWLRDHIYRPLSPRAGRALSTLAVFLISAIAHEVILALSFGFFYPVLMVEFGLLGLLMIPLTAASGRRFPNFLNLYMWFGFFIGNGLLWSLYPMEYFARKNCPPSENDSFFIPKSWSCPKVILKPNWTFQNPLEILD